MGKNKVDSQKGPANMGDNTHRTRKHTKWKARLDLIEAIHSSEGSWRRNAAYVIWDTEWYLIHACKTGNVWT